MKHFTTLFSFTLGVLILPSQTPTTNPAFVRNTIEVKVSNKDSIRFTPKMSPTHLSPDSIEILKAIDDSISKKICRFDSLVNQAVYVKQ